MAGTALDLGRARPADEYVAYLDAVHQHLSALLQSFRREPPPDVERRMRDAMLALRQLRQVLRLRPRSPVRLFELERTFRLDEFESFVVSMLTAYMFSGEIRGEIAAISESKMDYVSFELLARLYYPTRTERMAAMRALASGTLVGQHLVDMSAARTAAELPFAPIDLQPSIANYLLGVPVLREVMPLECEVTQPPAVPFTERVLGEHLVTVCRQVAAPRILLGGPRGAGKSTLARQVAGQLGRELITFTEPARGHAGWHGAVAKARAHDAFVLFRDCPGLLQSPTPAFLDALDRMEVPVLFASASGIEVAGRVRRRAHVVVEIEQTTAAEREATWKAAVHEAYAGPPAADLEALLAEIGAEFVLTKTQIARAVGMLRQQSGTPPGRVQLRQACERQMNP